MVEEGGVREVPPVGFIVREMVSYTRVIRDGCRHVVCPEGKYIGAEEITCNVGVQGGEPVSPPHNGSVVETVACGGEQGHAGIHDTGLHNHR